MTTEPQYRSPPTRRVEDGPLIRGEGRFADDLRVDGQLAGVFVRSVHAHAAIRGIDMAEALAHPGVVAILTATDMDAAGIGNIARPPPQKGRGDKPLIVPVRPALAKDRVVHVGETVALVVAETLAAARDAADLVVVDYDALPAISDATAALAEGAPQIWPEAPGNLAMDWVPPAVPATAAAEVQRIIAEAPQTVRIRVVNQRIAGVPLETRGATAIHDKARDHYTLHTGSQSAHWLKAGLVAMMGLAPNQLRVLCGDTGGAFGLKTPAYPEHVALLVAAKLTGRPVHWMATRSEAFQSDHQGRDNVSEATLAIDNDGRFLALDVSAIVNLGAYCSSSGAMIGSNSFANCMPTVYDIPHVSVNIRLAFTNTVWTGAYRGAGRPEANYVMERLVDEAARQTGIDPVTLRQRNFIAASAMPHRTAIGNVYDSGDFAGAFAKAAEVAGLGTFETRRREAAGRGRLRGLGISCFVEHAGGGPFEGAEMVFEGDELIVRLGMQASGQGHATLFRRMVAERLGLADEQVRISEGDSEVPFRGGPAIGSRSTNAAGMAIVDGVAKLTARAREVGAVVLEAPADAVSYRDGYVEVTGTNRRLSLFDLAAQAEEKGMSLTTVSQVEPLTTYPNGCHIAEVEIDPETGTTSLVTYVAVDDCGVVINPTFAESQVVGGLAQGFGQALMEHVVYDDDGQLISGSLMDYAMPRATDMPPIQASFFPVACRTNTLGVKGVGEAGTTAAIAAVMNAIADAVPGGAAIDMPATPERVWRACAAAQARTS